MSGDAWDVVIVGAGPAGSATAARLARRGHRVLVLDRETFPRRKACGECVNPAGVDALRALGAWERVAALGPVPLAGWSIRAHDGSAFRGRYPESDGGIGLPRARLDHALLQHAAAVGAAVREGVQVVDLVSGPNGVAGVRVRGGETISARIVVGADGLRSVVARRLGLPLRPPRLRKVALTAHLELPDGEPGEGGELRASPGGCLGLAPVAGRLADVTVVAAGAEAARVGGDPAGYFDRAVAAYGVRGQRVDEVLATGPFDFPMRSTVADGALLVGDAAGYFDPFTGQGIFRALRGAELAAGALDGALRADRLSADALRGYAAAHRAAFGAGERLQRLVELFVSRPAWLAWAARRLAVRPDLADALIRATGDLLPPRELLRPGLLLRSLRSSG